MHPQAVIVDTSALEEDYFLAGIRKQASALQIPVIEMPENSHSHLAWITKLDSSSLAGMNTSTCYPDASANMVSSLGQDQY